MGQIRRDSGAINSLNVKLARSTNAVCTMPLKDLIEQVVGISRRAAADMKRQDEFAWGDRRCLDPNAFGILFHFGRQLIQLEMPNRQSATKQPLMPQLTMDD